MVILFNNTEQIFMDPQAHVDKIWSANELTRWTNARILLIWPLGINFSENLF